MEEIKKELNLLLYFLLRYGNIDKKGVKTGYISGRTLIQKLVFLFAKKTELIPTIKQSYVPYHYGPYSTLLRDLVNMLVTNGLMKEFCADLGNRKFWYIFQFTEEGNKKNSEIEKTITGDEKEKIENFLNDYKDKKTQELIVESKKLMGMM